MDLLVILTPDERKKFFSDHDWSALHALAPDLRLLDPTGLDEAAFARAVDDADPEVILCGWSMPCLPTELTPRLRYLCYLTGSVRRLITRTQIEQGLLVTNWGTAISRTVAECALFHTLACLRKATRWTFDIHQEGGWRDGWESVGSLFQRRVGIHGFGAVARAFVELIRPFQCAVSVCAPDVNESAAARHGVRRESSLENLFADNDVLIELAPMIPATFGTVTELHFRLIRPGGVFVNVGRAAVTDEAALLRVAQEGNIFVGLDVFVNEPLPVDSGFRGLRNVSLSPHIAGPTLDRYGDATAFALKNLAAYAAGKPLEALITAEVYERSG